MEQGVEISGDCVVMSVGAAAALNCVCKALLNEGDNIVVPAPFFPEYRHYAKNSGGNLIEVPTKADFSLDIDAIRLALTDKTASVLKQYLNAATNGGFDSVRTCSKVKIVDIDRYLYDKTSKEFSKADEKAYPATLIYHKSTGEFTTTAQYDNQQDTFTLVTVTMTGYSTSDKFVLHIPVIVRRMLQVDFMATMTSGTVFNKTDGFYSETKNHALAYGHLPKRAHIPCFHPEAHRQRKPHGLHGYPYETILLKSSRQPIV